MLACSSVCQTCHVESYTENEICMVRLMYVKVITKETSDPQVVYVWLINIWYYRKDFIFMGLSINTDVEILIIE